MERPRADSGSQFEGGESYMQVEGADVMLTIQTAGRSLWANVLLTISCHTN